MDFVNLRNKVKNLKIGFFGIKSFLYSLGNNELS